MTKRTTKPADVKRKSWQIVQEATASAKASPEKNPAAVSLGRLGGQKGGPARAAKLSPARRSAIAKKAAKARWRSGSRPPSIRGYARG